MQPNVSINHDGIFKNMHALYSNSRIFVIPVYIFNGGKQTQVDRSAGMRMRAAIICIFSDLKLTILPDFAKKYQKLRIRIRIRVRIRVRIIVNIRIRVRVRVCLIKIIFR